MPSGLNASEKLWAVIQVLVGILTAVNLGLTSWALVSIVQLRETSAAASSNRYTDEEAKIDNERTADQLLALWRQIADIREEMANKLDSDKVPTDETIRWLEGHDKAIEQLRSIKQTP